MAKGKKDGSAGNVLSLLKQGVQVDVIIIKNENNAVKYEAKMKCPVCSSITLTTKDPNAKSRWILSNFKRHLTLHLGKKNNSKKSAEATETSAETIETSTDFPHVSCGSWQDFTMNSGM